MSGARATRADSWPDTEPDGVYFNAAAETMPAAEMEQLQLERLREQLSYVRQNSGFYRDKWSAAGFDPALVESLASFDAPFTTKEELRASQSAAPPLGRHAAAAMEHVIRVHSSSGTTGRPSYVGITPADQRSWVEVVSRVLYCEGMRRRDVVVHGFGLGFFVGGLPLKDATERIGATFVPIGTGATDRLVTSIRDLSATVLMCTPSYATYLAEYCRDRLDTDPATLGLRTLLLGAEPGAGIPAMRDQIEQDFAASVSEGIGNADLFPIYGASCPARQGMHLCAQDLMLAEVIDPETGQRLPWESGAEGELVATHLRRECVPLVRFRVRDRVVVDASPCSCGRTSPRVHCAGRTDDMLIVAGVNVWPSAVKDVVCSLRPRTTGAVQIVVSGESVRVDPPLHIQVEYGPDEEGLRQLKDDLEQALRNKLIFKAAVELVPPSSLPRWEMKAQLVRRQHT